MAFPFAENWISSSRNTDGTLHAFTVPASNVGEVLWLFARFSTSGSITSGLDGWTVELENTDDPSNDMTLVASRVVDGSESNLIIQTADANKHAGGILRVSGANTSILDDIQGAAGASPVPYGTHTLPHGAKDYLLFYFGGREGENATTSLPTDCSDIAAPNSGTGGSGATNVLTRFGQRSANLSSWSPTGTPSNVQMVVLLAIHPEPTGTEHPLAGNAAGSADAVGNLDVARSLSGSAAGQGDATANLRRAITLAGLAEGESSAGGTLSFLIELAGLSAGSSDASGALRLQRGLSGEAAGSSSAEAALRIVRALSGSAVGEADGIGSLAVLKALAGLADGTSDAIALLGVDRALSGMVHGSSAVVGSLSIVVSLSGLVEGDSTAIANLRRAVALAGLAEGDSTLTANLTVLDEGGPLPFIVLTLERSRIYADVSPSESLVELAPSRTHAEVLQ